MQQRARSKYEDHPKVQEVKEDQCGRRKERQEMWLKRLGVGLRGDSRQII